MGLRKGLTGLWVGKPQVLSTKPPIDFYLDCDNETAVLVDEDMKDVETIDLRRLLEKHLAKRQEVL